MASSSKYTNLEAYASLSLNNDEEDGLILEDILDVTCKERWISVWLGVFLPIGM